MDRKKLFEIPVYSISPELFEKCWKNKLDQQAATIEDTADKKVFQEQLKREYYPLYVWEYNEIIGYIQIFLEHNDIVFEVYSSDKDRIQLFSSRKPRIRPIFINGCHFRVEDSFTNSDIANKIIEWLNFVEKEHIHKGRFLAREAFDALVNHVDYKAIIKEFLEEV